MNLIHALLRRVDGILARDFLARAIIGTGVIVRVAIRAQVRVAGLLLSKRIS